MWSSRFTWGGLSPPEKGSFAVITKGQTILLDTNTPVLKMLLIQGRNANLSWIFETIKRSCLIVFDRGQSFLPFCILLLLFSFLSFHLKQFIRSQIKFIYYFLGAKYVTSLESSLLSTTQTSIFLSCQQVNNNTCYYNFVN